MKRLASAVSPRPCGCRQKESAAQHEALLVRADRRADHLRRDIEKILVEGAHQHDRPFDEAGDLFEERLVLDEFETLREGEVLGIVQDDVLAAVLRRARPCARSSAGT